MRKLLRKAKKKSKKIKVEIPWIDKATWDFEQKWLRDREELWWREGPMIIQ